MTFDLEASYFDSRDTYDERLKRTTQNIEALKDELIELEEYYGKLYNMHKINYSEILSYFEHDCLIKPNWIISIDFKTEKYNHILGGDDRSKPYDEKRTDSIITIYIDSNYYISYKQEELLKHLFCQYKDISDKQLVKIIKQNKY